MELSPGDGAIRCTYVKHTIQHVRADMSRNIRLCRSDVGNGRFESTIACSVSISIENDASSPSGTNKWGCWILKKTGRLHPIVRLSTRDFVGSASNSWFESYGDTQ